MAEEALEVEIDVDETPGVRALDRFNKKAKEAGDLVVSVGRTAGAAFGDITKALIKGAEVIGAVAIAAGSWKALTLALRGSTAAAIEHQGAAGVLLNTYRAVRLALSPTMFTAFTIAAGIALEHTAGLVLARGKLIQQDALLAASSKQSFQAVSTLGTAGVLYGAGRGAFQSLFEGRTASGITDLVNQFQELKDPMDKAAFAVEHFGENAEKVLPLLNDRLKENIARAYELSEAFDAHTRASLDRMSSSLRYTIDAFHSTGDALRELREEAKQAIVVTIVRVVDTTNSVSDFIARQAQRIPGNPLGAKTGAQREAELQKLNEAIAKRTLPSDFAFAAGATEATKKLFGSSATVGEGLAGAKTESDIRNFFKGFNDSSGRAISEFESSYAYLAGRVEHLKSVRAALVNGLGAAIGNPVLEAVTRARLAGVASELRPAEAAVRAVEDRRRGIEGVLNSREELLKAGGGLAGSQIEALINPTGLSTTEKLIYDFAISIRPQYLVDENGNVRVFRQPADAIANLAEINRLKIKEELHGQSAKLIGGAAQSFEQNRAFPGVPLFAEDAVAEQYGATLRGGFALALGANRRAGSAEVLGAERKAQLEDRLKEFQLVKDEREVTERILELRAGPGGEIAAADKVAESRLRTAREEFKITGENYQLIRESQRVALDHERRLAEIQRNRIDSLKSSISSLFDAAFAGGRGLLDSVKRFVTGIILAPVKEGLSTILANQLYPALYGRDGRGGILGGLYKAFGAGQQDTPIRLNTSATDRNTAAVNELTRSITGTGGAASGYGGTTLPPGFPGVLGATSALAGLLPALGLASIGGVGRSAAAGLAGAANGLGGLVSRLFHRVTADNEDIGAGRSGAAGLTRLSNGLIDRAGVSAGGYGGPFNRLAGAGAGSFASTVGGPGGTSGFAGPVGGAAAGGFSLAGLGAGILPLLGLGLTSGGLQKKSAAQTIIGSTLLAAGLGLAGAPISGLTGLGFGVAAAGLQRGGFSGLGMSIGGGALAGATLGTMAFPGIGTLAGAAIGAGAGAIAGLIRLGIKGKSEQAHNAIKSVYGADIPSSSGTMKQILQIVDQNFGGSISVGIRSPQIRELISLYSLSTGGRPFLDPNTPRAGYFGTSGGSLSQSPGFFSGYQFALPSAFPGSSAAAAYPAPYSFAVTVNNQMSPSGTRDWLSGQRQTVSTLALAPNVTRY